MLSIILMKEKTASYSLPSPLLGKAEAGAYILKILYQFWNW